MRILIYGAGVLGSVYAAHLHEGGHDVTVLARGKRLADIREHGIVLEELSAERRKETEVHVVERLEPTDAYDLVLVIMRKNQVASVLPVLCANQHTPNVAFLMNNAAGPGELVKALRRERVLMGFPGAGGVFKGHVVRYATKGKGARRLETTMGELDGTTTPRLRRIVDTFSQANISIVVESHIDAWLKTHVALVSPIAQTIYRAGGDNYALARDRKTIRLMLRAVREGLRVIQALNLPIAPRHLKLLNWFPLWVQVPLVRKVLSTEFAEVALAGHANAARDELEHLAEEFRMLIQETSIPTPAIDALC
jgi:2-dehydropantoate 2-reductase